MYPVGYPGVGAPPGLRPNLPVYQPQMPYPQMPYGRMPFDPHYHPYPFPNYGSMPPPPGAHMHRDAYGRPYLHVGSSPYHGDYAPSGVPEGHVSIPVSTLQTLLNNNQPTAPSHSVAIIEPATSTVSHSAGPTAVTYAAPQPMVAQPASMPVTYTSAPQTVVSSLPQQTSTRPGSPRGYTYR